MQKNVGGRDRTARLVAGTALLLVGVLGYVGQFMVAFGPFPQAVTAMILFVAGLGVVGTAVTQRCLVNKLLGRNTCNR